MTNNAHNFDVKGEGSGLLIQNSPLCFEMKEGNLSLTGSGANTTQTELARFLIEECGVSHVSFLSGSVKIPVGCTNLEQTEKAIFKAMRGTFAKVPA